ncbi:MAG TPA: hypothetical protein VHE13_17250 [Opitutus sp.]|nr:hypothetical protein [Opitutus sp.]
MSSSIGPAVISANTIPDAAPESSLADLLAAGPAPTGPTPADFAAVVRATISSLAAKGNGSADRPGPNAPSAPAKPLPGKFAFGWLSRDLPSTGRDPLTASAKPAATTDSATADDADAAPTATTPAATASAQPAATPAIDVLEAILAGAVSPQSTSLPAQVARADADAGSELTPESMPANVDRPAAKRPSLSPSLASTPLAQSSAAASGLPQPVPVEQRAPVAAAADRVTTARPNLPASATARESQPQASSSALPTSLETLVAAANPVTLPVASTPGASGTPLNSGLTTVIRNPLARPAPHVPVTDATVPAASAPVASPFVALKRVASAPAAVNTDSNAATSVWSRLFPSRGPNANNPASSPAGSTTADTDTTPTSPASSAPPGVSLPWLRPGATSPVGTGEPPLPVGLFHPTWERPVHQAPLHTHQSDSGGHPIYDQFLARTAVRFPPPPVDDSGLIPDSSAPLDVSAQTTASAPSSSPASSATFKDNAISVPATPAATTAMVTSARSASPATAPASTEAQTTVDSQSAPTIESYGLADRPTRAGNSGASHSARSSAIATENSSVNTGGASNQSSGNGEFASNRDATSYVTNGKNVSSDVGIDVADPSSDMEFSEPAQPSLPVHHATGTFHADVLAPDSSTAPAQSLDANPATAANQVLASVLRVIDRPDRAESSRVSLQFSFGSEPLAVHVELRGDQVHTTFQCASSEMHAALAREWPQFVAQLPENTTAPAQPHFVSTLGSATDSSRQGSSGREHPAWFDGPAASAATGSSAKTASATTRVAATRHPSLQVLDVLA